MLKPGKIYTYYVVAYYENGGIRYPTMNPASSSVVWGIPQPQDDISGGIYAASMLGDGSLGMIVSIVAVILAAASLGIVIKYKKKTAPDETDEE